MRLSELAARRVALWGLGREGRATLRAIRAVLPALPLTVVDDRPLPPELAAELAAAGGVEVLAGPAAAAALGGFEVVVRSPGVSLYRPEVEAARRRGTVFTSATRIFFAERPAARTVCVTGTKGKSTTTSLVAHLLAAAGVEAELRGNIGRPLLEPVAHEPAVWVIELSSYQTADLDADPTVAVLTSLYPEHLDWHGDLETYYRDKLHLFAGQATGVAVVNRADPETLRQAAVFRRPRWFNDEAGFHVAGGAIRRGDRPLLALDEIPLPGAHNHGNVCAALTAVEALGHDAAALAGAVRSFRGLPHRLMVLGERDGLVWVDDSISTTPQSAAAALAAFAGRPLTLLLGGHDRGLDYRELAREVVARGVELVLTLPASGPRIAAAVRAARGEAARPAIVEAADLASAVAAARRRTPRGGIVLLSPAAPSYGAFRDFVERGEAFAAAAGFGSTDGAESSPENLQ